jgi:hypothetical protein
VHLQTGIEKGDKIGEAKARQCDTHVVWSNSLK